MIFFSIDNCGYSHGSKRGNNNNNNNNNNNQNNNLEGKTEDQVNNFSYPRCNIYYFKINYRIIKNQLIFTIYPIRLKDTRKNQSTVL